MCAVLLAHCKDDKARKAYLEQENRLGETALHSALEDVPGNLLSTVRFLIESGAAINGYNSKGAGLLDYAFRSQEKSLSPEQRKALSDTTAWLKAKGAKSGFAMMERDIAFKAGGYKTIGTLLRETKARTVTKEIEDTTRLFQALPAMKKKGPQVQLLVIEYQTLKPSQEHIKETTGTAVDSWNTISGNKAVSSRVLPVYETLTLEPDKNKLYGIKVRKGEPLGIVTTQPLESNSYTVVRGFNADCAIAQFKDAHKASWLKPQLAAVEPRLADFIANYEESRRDAAKKGFKIPPRAPNKEVEALRISAEAALKKGDYQEALRKKQDHLEAFERHYKPHKTACSLLFIYGKNGAVFPAISDNKEVMNIVLSAGATLNALEKKGDAMVTPLDSALSRLKEMRTGKDIRKEWIEDLEETIKLMKSKGAKTARELVAPKEKEKAKEPAPCMSQAAPNPLFDHLLATTSVMPAALPPIAVAPAAKSGVIRL